MFLILLLLSIIYLDAKSFWKTNNAPMQILYNLKIISLSTVVLLKIKNECIKMALRGIFAILDD